MKIADLIPSDQGRTVIFTPFRVGSKKGTDKEHGIISSYGARSVFVKFRIDALYGVACSPDDLEFLE
jgi:hypothetical protein